MNHDAVNRQPPKYQIATPRRSVRLEMQLPRDHSSFVSHRAKRLRQV
jgi:hypothetical protein